MPASEQVKLAQTRLIPIRGNRLLATLESVILHAREFHDGHFYLFSFTTGYKGGFGTPDLDTGGGRGAIWSLDGFKSIEELLDHMLTPSCGCIRLSGMDAR